MSGHDAIPAEVPTGTHRTAPVIVNRREKRRRGWPSAQATRNIGTRSEIDAAFRDLPSLRVVTEQIQQHPDVAVARGHCAEPA